MLTPKFSNRNVSYESDISDVSSLTQDILQLAKSAGGRALYDSSSTFELDSPVKEKFKKSRIEKDTGHMDVSGVEFDESNSDITASKHHGSFDSPERQKSHSEKKKHRSADSPRDETFHREKRKHTSLESPDRQSPLSKKKKRRSLESPDMQRSHSEKRKHGSFDSHSAKKKHKHNHSHKHHSVSEDEQPEQEPEKKVVSEKKRKSGRHKHRERESDEENDSGKDLFVDVDMGNKLSSSSCLHGQAVNRDLFDDVDVVKIKKSPTKKKCDGKGDGDRCSKDESRCSDDIDKEGDVSAQEEEVRQKNGSSPQKLPHRKRSAKEISNRLRKGSSSLESDSSCSISDGELPAVMEAIKENKKSKSRKSGGGDKDGGIQIYSDDSEDELSVKRYAKEVKERDSSPSKKKKKSERRKESHTESPSKSSDVSRSKSKKALVSKGVDTSKTYEESSDSSSSISSMDELPRKKSSSSKKSSPLKRHSGAERVTTDDGSTLREMQPPEQKLRYTPKHMAKTSAGDVLLTEEETEDTEIWLIKVPTDFDISELAGQNIPLNGEPQFLPHKDEHMCYKLTSGRHTDEKNSWCSVLASSSGDNAVLGPAVSGQIHVMERLRPHPGVQIEVPPPYHHEIPGNLRQRYKPFGSRSPEREDPVVMTESHKKFKKKKKKKERD